MTKPKPKDELQKRGRKPIEIDYTLAENAASIMCTQSEIAALLGVSLGKLEHDPEFQRIHKKGLEVGKQSLRRMQYAAAEKGNPTMLIWLGKQYLKQSDKQEITGKDGAPLNPRSMTDEELMQKIIEDYKSTKPTE